MGLFDLPGPLLAQIDAGLAAAGMAPLGRLVVWGALAGAAAMAIYRLVSSQRRLAALKAEIAATRRDILAYEGDFAGVRPLLRRSIVLSFRQVGLCLAPSAIASLPVLIMVAWLNGAYAYALPEPGETVHVSVTPADAPARWRPARVTATEGAIPWPRAPVELIDAEGSPLLSLPLAHAIPVVHQRVWWNGLFGNPNGYLPDSSGIERVDLDLPRARYLAFGPPWLGRWEAVFFATMIAASLAIKVAFRIR